MFGWVRAGGIAATAFMLGASALVGSPTAAVSVENPRLSQGFHDHEVAETVAITAAAEQVALPSQVEAGEPDGVAQPTVPEPATPVDAPVAATPPVSIDPPKPAKKATLASMVAERKAAEVADREIECLATAIYYESKSESLAGQLAVGQVIRNRAESGRFPRSLCGVVLQRSQFSFVRGGRLPAVPRASGQWKTAVAVAKIVADDLHEDIVPRALFFHARHVSPRWKLKRLQSVGNHVFYR